MKTAWMAAALTVAMAGSGLAADAAATIKARQQGMKAVGSTTKALNDGLNGDASAAEIRALADRLDRLAEQSMGWFPAGTGPGSGVKTAAKADIWTRPAEFTVARAAFAAQAEKLKAAAAGGDTGAVKAAFGDLRRTCKTCHDGFKAKD